MNKRYITLRINLRGIDLTDFINKAQDEIQKNVKYNHTKNLVRWSGQFENQNRAYSRLAMIIPFAFFGGMLALNVSGMTLNVSSAVGFIALFGVSIQNGVIMISHMNALRKGGMELKEAVLSGARHRFRPILMIAMVAVVGLFPASVSTGIGSDVQRPLATVIVYGLFFATIITLYVLPPLYFLMEKRWGAKN